MFRRLCCFTYFWSGGPGETSLALVDHMLWSEGHLISALSVSFQYVSGYGCIPPTTGGGSCDGAANISLAIVDAVNKSIVRTATMHSRNIRRQSPAALCLIISQWDGRGRRSSRSSFGTTNEIYRSPWSLAWGGKRNFPMEPRQFHGEISRTGGAPWGNFVSGDVPSAAGIIAMAKNLLS